MPEVAQDLPKVARNFSKSCSKVAPKNLLFVRKVVEKLLRKAKTPFFSLFAFLSFHLTWCKKYAICTTTSQFLKICNLDLN